MNEELNSKKCRRCQTENRIEHNFCWLCGIGFIEQPQDFDQPIQRQIQTSGASAGASVGAGIAGVLAGAMGGIVVGILIVVAFIMTILNAIGEMLDGCAGMLFFMSLTVSAGIYSIVSWLF